MGRFGHLPVSNSLERQQYDVLIKNEVGRTFCSGSISHLQFSHNSMPTPRFAFWSLLIYIDLRRLFDGYSPKCCFSALRTNPQRHKFLATINHSCMRTWLQIRIALQSPNRMGHLLLESDPQLFLVPVDRDLGLRTQLQPGLGTAC